MRPTTLLRPATLLLLAATPGCFTPTHRIAQRTALEQQLTSLAIDRCVARLELSRADLPGDVHLEVVATKGVPRDYVRHRIERRLAELGSRVAPSDDARLPTLIVEVAVAGSDTEATLIGVPLSTTAGGAPVADVSLLKIDSQYGRARMSVLLRSRDGALTSIAEDVGGSAQHSVWTFLTFIGPFLDTDVEAFFE